MSIARMNLAASGSLKTCVILAAALATVFLSVSSASAATVFHYRVNDTDEPGLPNIPSVGGADGTAQGSTPLSADIPTLGVPAGAGNRSLTGGALGGGVISPATQELTNALIIANGGFTFESWFKWNGAGSWNAIIDYAGTEKFRVRNGNLDMNFDLGSGAQILVTAPTQNEWHYIAAAFDHDGNPEVGGQISGTLTWYYDDNLPTDTASVTKDDFGDTLNRAIGTGLHPLGFGGDHFNGLIYEPRVSLGALTADQLLYGQAAVIPEPSTFVLAALGLLGLGVVGCRRRRR